MTKTPLLLTDFNRDGFLDRVVREEIVVNGKAREVYQVELGTADGGYIPLYREPFYAGQYNLGSITGNRNVHLSPLWYLDHPGLNTVPPQQKFTSSHRPAPQVPSPPHSREHLLELCRNRLSDKLDPSGHRSPEVGDCLYYAALNPEDHAYQEDLIFQGGGRIFIGDAPQEGYDLQHLIPASAINGDIFKPGTQELIENIRIRVANRTSLDPDDYFFCHQKGFLSDEDLIKVIANNDELIAKKKLIAKDELPKNWILDILKNESARGALIRLAKRNPTCVYPLIEHWIGLVRKHETFIGADLIRLLEEIQGTGKTLEMLEALEDDPSVPERNRLQLTRLLVIPRMLRTPIKTVDDLLTVFRKITVNNIPVNRDQFFASVLLQNRELFDALVQRMGEDSVSVQSREFRFFISLLDSMTLRHQNSPWSLPPFDKLWRLAEKAGRTTTTLNDNRRHVVLDLRINLLILAVTNRYGATRPDDFMAAWPKVSQYVRDLMESDSAEQRNMGNNFRDYLLPLSVHAGNPPHATGSYRALSTSW